MAEAKELLQAIKTIISNCKIHSMCKGCILKDEKGYCKIRSAPTVWEDYIEELKFIK